MKEQPVGKTEEMALLPSSCLLSLQSSSFFVSCAVINWIFLVDFHPRGWSAPFPYLFVTSFAVWGQDGVQVQYMWRVNEDWPEFVVSFSPGAKLTASASPLPAGPT